MFNNKKSLLVGILSGVMFAGAGLAFAETEDEANDRIYREEVQMQIYEWCVVDCTETLSMSVNAAEAYTTCTRYEYCGQYKPVKK